MIDSWDAGSQQRRRVFVGESLKIPISPHFEKPNAESVCLEFLSGTRMGG